MINYSDLEDAFLFVSSDMYGMHTAIVNKDTGQIFYRSERGDIDEIDEDDMDWESCIKIPHKNELDLGQELVFEFVEDHLSDAFEQVRRIFSRRGAYSRFKYLLESRGLLQKWYDFQNQREDQALRHWCELEGLEISG